MQKMTVGKLIGELVRYPARAEVDVTILYGENGRKIKGLSVQEPGQTGKGKMIIMYDSDEDN